MELFTIGHSTRSARELLALLQGHAITAVADVRSSPYSKYNPQFNREELMAELAVAGIDYVYLGKELGPRSDDPACLVAGKAAYDRLARTALFRAGLERLREGVKRYRVVLLCAEQDPLTCHRMILITRQLRGRDMDIRHILEDGRLEENAAAERRLLKLFKLPVGGDLFNSHEQLVDMAYDRQAAKIAYAPTPEGEEQP